MNEITNPDNFKKRMAPITVGVSGHINISEEGINLATIEFRDFVEALFKKYPNTPIQLLTSLAVGADRIAAKVFLDLRSRLKATYPEVARQCELIVVLPMKSEIFMSDFENSAEEFQTLLSHADATLVMPISHSSNSDDILIPGEARNRQYQDATRYIAVHADILVAFWDGLDPKKIGGTHDAVRMRLFGHEVTDGIHYSPLANGVARLVHHINVARQSVSPEAILETAFFENSNYSTKIGNTISRFTDGIEIDKFNRTIMALGSNDKFEQSLNFFFHNPELFDQIKKLKLDYSTKFCVELYGTADALSIRSERIWNKLTKSIYGIGLATAILLPVAIEDIFLPWTMFGYIALLVMAFGAYIWIKRSRLENRHIESRALAELLRIQIVWLYSGFDENSTRVISNTNPDYFPPNISTALLGQQLLNIGWIGRVLTSLIVFRPTYCESSVQDLNADIVEDWIVGQKSYFQRSQLKSERAAEKLGLFSKLFVFGGLISAFCAVTMSHFDVHVELIHRLLVINAAAMPIMSVVLENFSENFGFEAKAKINERLFDVFDSADRLMKVKSLPDRIKDALVIEVGKETVSEAMMWYFLRRSKPIKVAM